MTSPALPLDRWPSAMAAEPLAIAAERLDPERLERLLRAIEGRTPTARVAASDVSGLEPARQPAVAVIPLVGQIVPRLSGSWSAEDSYGLVSAEHFAAQVATAATDPNISSIVLAVDSPGGSVYGVEEAAQVVRQARERKPVVAVAQYMAASAAYYLASQATKVVAPASAVLGSIGVLLVSRDVSGLYESIGIKHTIIQAGEAKADGHPYRPLSEAAQARLQERVDHYYAQFVAAVASGRRVSREEVLTRYGQGRMFPAAEAKRLGMIDEIGTLSQVVGLLTGQTR